jgi:hypothetical protein
MYIEIEIVSILLFDYLLSFQIVAAASWDSDLHYQNRCSTVQCTCFRFHILTGRFRYFTFNELHFISFKEVDTDNWQISTEEE